MLSSSNKYGEIKWNNLHNNINDNICECYALVIID